MEKSIEMDTVIENTNTAPDISTSKLDQNNSVFEISEENNASNEDGNNKKTIVIKLWQLITFFRRVFIYFVVVVIADQGLLYLPNWARLIFKVLPVLTLIVFIYNQFTSLIALFRNKYSLLISLGLFASAIGDAMLVYQKQNIFFMLGLGFFAVAHILYTFAFGWKPLKSRMLFRSVIAASLVYYYLYSGSLKTSGLVLVIGVAVYVTIIFAMQWRAWARLSDYDITNGRWYEIIGAFGASFFALSDAIIGINKFNFTVPGADYSIIATYYIAQLLIALSVVDGPNINWPQDVAARQQEIESCTCDCNNPSKCFKESIKRAFDWIIS